MTVKRKTRMTMKIDNRLRGTFSNDEIIHLTHQANKLAPGEGKVVSLYKQGFRYEIALIHNEITAFPLNPA